MKTNTAASQARVACWKDEIENLLAIESRMTIERENIRLKMAQLLRNIDEEIAYIKERGKQ